MTEPQTNTALFGGKTPISYLQELCTKRQTTPEYTLIANEGAVHEPIFLFSVTSGEFTGTGKGSSKKKARHSAAEQVLRQMMGTPNGDAPDNVAKEEPTAAAKAVPYDDGIPGNPIGELQEFTQKRLMRPPIYKFPSEQGPPHAREFVAIVTLGKMQETGVAKSKKVAKRLAAHKMLTSVKQIVATQDGDLTSQLEETEEEGIPMIPKDAKIPSLNSTASKKISAFYAGMKSATGKSLASLQNKQLNSPTVNYCQLLQQIAEEQRFEVTYVDIGEPGPAGMRQCLVQLSTMPVAVCHGSGPTQDEAHAQAAHNALQYLKIMTKKA